MKLNYIQFNLLFPVYKLYTVHKMDAIKIIMGNDFHFALLNKINHYSKNKSTESNINLNIINAEGEPFIVSISETDFYSPLHTYIHKIIIKDLEPHAKAGSSTINNYLSLHSFSINDQFNVTLNHILKKENFQQNDYLKINFNHHSNQLVFPSTNDLYFHTFLTEIEMKRILYKMSDAGLPINSNFMQLSGEKLTFELVFNLHKFIIDEHDKI